MTAATAGEAKRPPLTIELKLEDGTKKEIKWTYGLFNDLQRTVHDAAGIIDAMLIDPFTRDYIIRRCMSGLKKMVEDPKTELPPVEDIGLDDPDEIDKLLQWATGHLLYFFAISAGGLRQLSEQFKARVPPAPSTTGSQN